MKLKDISLHSKETEKYVYILNETERIFLHINETSILNNRNTTVLAHQTARLQQLAVQQT